MGTIFLPCCSPPGVEAWPSGEFRQLLLFEAPDEQQLQVRNLSREKSWRIRIQNGWMKWYFHNLCSFGAIFFQGKSIPLVYHGLLPYLRVFFRVNILVSCISSSKNPSLSPADLAGALPGTAGHRQHPAACSRELLVVRWKSVGSGLPESLDGGIMHILCMCVWVCVCIHNLNPRGLQGIGQNGQNGVFEKVAVLKVYLERLHECWRYIPKMEWINCVVGIPETVRCGWTFQCFCRFDGHFLAENNSIYYHNLSYIMFYHVLSI